MTLAYQIWDVFTETPLTGNPLAVVLGADELDTATMQAIAGEFNLSETVFVSAGTDGADASLRIFTPASELPFAGHPTVGSAVALGQGRDAIALALTAGRVNAVLLGNRAAFDAPLIPTLSEGAPSAEAAAIPLGLSAQDIGFPGAPMPVRARSGPSFTLVPIADPSAVSRIQVDGAGLAGVFGEDHSAIFAVAHDGDGYRARMFAPVFGIAEDPATGAASVAFAALIGPILGDGEHAVQIVQGVEMGRRSEIGLNFSVTNGELVRVGLSGSAVCVARGELLV